MPNKREISMRAERDEDQVRPSRAKPQRRLAYEIAFGIILGGAGLWLLQVLTGLIAAKFMLQQIQFHLPG
jgi:hypothetical protein